MAIQHFADFTNLEIPIPSTLPGTVKSYAQISLQTPAE